MRLRCNAIWGHFPDEPRETARSRAGVLIVDGGYGVRIADFDGLPGSSYGAVFRAWALHFGTDVPFRKLEQVVAQGSPFPKISFLSHFAREKNVQILVRNTPKAARSRTKRFQDLKFRR